MVNDPRSKRASVTDADPAAERAAQQTAITEQLVALAGPAHRAEVERLVADLADLASSEAADADDATWRYIGHFLCHYGAPHVWQALFIASEAQYGLSATGGYRPNDEWRYLVGKDWRLIAAQDGWPVAPELDPDPEEPATVEAALAVWRAAWPASEAPDAPHPAP